MTRFFIFLVLTIVLIGVVSAVSFDNVKTYDIKSGEKYGTITIRNLYGLGGILADVKLNDNTDKCLSDCSSSGTTDLTYGGKLIEKISFKDTSGKEKNLPYKIYIQQGTETKETPTYEKVCVNSGARLGNGTQPQECSLIETGVSRTEIPKWVEYNNEELEAGTYTWKITATKPRQLSVDWVVTIQGVEMTEWAWWIGYSPTAYWKFNEVSGTTANDEVSTNDFTIYNTTVINFTLGKLGNAVYISNKSVGVLSNLTVPNSPIFLPGRGNFTLAFWFNYTGNASNNIVMIDQNGQGFQEANAWGVRLLSNRDETANLTFDSESNGGEEVVVTGNLKKDIWNRIVYVRESNDTNGFKIYVNGVLNVTGTISGVLNNSAPFNFLIKTPPVAYLTSYLFDDMQWYNGTAWSSADVVTDWNRGFGVEADGSTDNFIVSLTSPDDNSNVLSSQKFNATFSANYLNFTNATLFIWNSASVLQGTTTVLITGNTTNSSSLSLAGLGNGYNYTWNYYACGVQADDITANNCTFASANRTMNITTYSIGSETYSASTIEGSVENFKINVSLNSTGLLSSAYLFYNNTLYSPSLTSVSNDYYLSANIVVPSVASQTNISFNWIFNSGVQFNSTVHNQSVDIISIDDCSSFTNVVLNYTMKDEFSQLNVSLTLNPSIELNVLIYPMSGGNSILNISGIYNNSINAKICLENSLTSSSEYRLDAQAKYSADGYVTRHNYIQNMTMTNLTIPQNIVLLNLNSSLDDTKKFLLTYKNSRFLAVPSALINIQKQYLAENTFKTVEIEQTNDLGQAVAYIDLGGRYTITVTKDGQLLSTFENVIAFCENQLTGDCKISLDASFAFSSARNFYTYNNLAYSQSYNTSTKIYGLTFATLDSSTSLVSINLTKFDGYSNLTICSSQTITSAGSLTCNVSSYSNITFIAGIYKDGILVAQTLYSISDVIGTDIFAGNLVIFLLGIVLFFGIIFIPSPIATVIGVIIGFAVASILFFVTGAYFLGSTFIFLVLVGFIILWRLRSGGND